MSWLGDVVTRPSAAATPNVMRPTTSSCLRPIAVAERACEQQQPREHDGVRVDDPGQLGLARAGVAGEAGEGDIETADRGHDRHQGERDHEQDGPWMTGRRGYIGCERGYPLPSA